MASSSNIGVARLPWGRLPRPPAPSATSVGGGASCSSELEMSFRDIMAEQQRETSQDREFEEYIQNSYVTVETTTPSSEEGQVVQDDPNQTEEIGKSFVQLEDQQVLGLLEEQDVFDISYELAEQELDQLADDESDKYYEGLAKKLSTVVELQNGSLTQSIRARGNAATPLPSLPNNKAGGNLGNRSANSMWHSADLNSFLDPQSKVILEKLLRKGVLRGGSTSAFKLVHLGKSATICHAAGGKLTRLENASSSGQNNGNLQKTRLLKECAVKVFMNTTSTPANTPDCRSEEEPRTMAAKREMIYLNRMTRAGIPCPHVQFLVGHVLVIEFLGKDGVPAKILKDALDLTRSRTNLATARQQVVDNMKTLFKTCHLVLGNITEASILWHKKQVYFTSVGGAVNCNRPEALELLYRDCVHITEFFNKKSNDYQQTPEELFRLITGFDFAGQLQHEDISGGTCAEEGFALV